MEITHPEKVLYPKTGHTKQAIVDYYKRVEQVFLSYLVDRPVSLVRAPEGAAAIKFYQRHPQEYFPNYIERVKIEAKQGSGVYILIDSLEDIEYLVNIGTLEFHVWNATAVDPGHTSEILFDLDPGPEVTNERLLEAAWLIHEKLDWLGHANYVKTSGIKGYHICAVLDKKVGWIEAKSDAKLLADDLTKKHPRLFTTVLTKQSRGEHIFIDYLRNAEGATQVAPFSTRAIDKPSVSVPFPWGVLHETEPALWTIDTLPQKLITQKWWKLE